MRKTIFKTFVWAVATLLLCSHSLFATINNVTDKEIMHDVGVLKGIYDDYSKNEAALRLETIAEKDSAPYAMNVLGLLYMNGIGTEKDSEKAIYWLGKAGEHGFSDAYHNLGVIYKLGGNGIAQNFNAAYNAFHKGAEQGSNICRYDEGFMLYKGLGCIQDYGKALSKFQVAADSGNVYATYMLGLCYRNGYGTEQNEEKGLEILRQAALLGYSAAVEELARPYPENCLTNMSVSDSLNNTFPSSMPMIHTEVNDTNLLKGIYRGYVVMYDWSGQHILGEKPASLSLGRTRDKTQGFLVLGDDSIPFIANITKDGMLKFEESYVDLNERYTFDGKVRYKLCQAALDIWSDRIHGNLSLYSQKEHEPQRPIYVALYRDGSYYNKNFNKYGYIIISPNPFDTELCANFELNERSDASARIFNKYGMLVWHQTLGTFEAGKHNLKLHPDILPGIYVLNISAGKQVLRTTVVKK